MEDGDGTWEEYESSLFLGQQPSPEQLERTRRKLSALDPIRCAPRDEAWRGCGRISMRRTPPCCAKLSKFLTETVFHIPPGARYLPRYATDEEGTLESMWLKACEAEAPERRAALRAAVGERTGRCAEGASARQRRRSLTATWARDLLAMTG